MRIPVVDLVGQPGATRHVDATLARGDVDAPPGSWGPAEEVLDSPIHIDLDLEMLVEGLLARGHLTFSTVVPCALCLTDVRADRAVDVLELYADPRRADPDDEVEVGYELHPEGLIDLEAMFRDAIMDSLPLRTLCRPDCRGLCAVCGADRNVEDCGHDRGAARDPRWAALEQLQSTLGR